MTRKTLSCCIVVRNEEQRIVDCLEHITYLADEIIIIDTGSKDRTCVFARSWATSKHAGDAVKVIEVGTRFHDSDGDFDFGAAKTYAFSLASKDYVMWLDAYDRVQEQIIVKRKFIEVTADKDVIITMPTATSKKHAFSRLRIGPRLKSTIVGRVHEYMYMTDLTGLIRVHINIPILNEKPKRDLNRNIKLLIKEWDREASSRIAFYIGNSYYGQRNYDDAIVWFRKRIYNFEWADEHAEEYYKALECIADCTLKIFAVTHKSGHIINIDDVLDVTNEMIRRDPLRVEGYYYRGLYYIERKDYTTAMDNLRKFSTCKVPVNVKLWLDDDIYRGTSVSRAIEKCKTALKYSEVLVPEEISDYNSMSGTYMMGDSQYSRNPNQTIF